MIEHERLVTGIIYQKNGQPSFQVQARGYAEIQLSAEELMMSNRDFDKLEKEFM